MSDEHGGGVLTRRSAIAAAGSTLLAGVGIAGGYRLLSDERDANATRQLTVDDEFDLDEGSTSSLPAAEREGDAMSQVCDPDPDVWGGGTHVANVTMVRAWNEPFELWGSEREIANREPGVGVQNSVVLEKAPERVDGQYLYYVRLYSLGSIESGWLSRYRLTDVEHRLNVAETAAPAVSFRTGLPERPIGPRDGNCTLTLFRQLPSGHRAGYERSWSVAEGRLDADLDDHTATVSYRGPTSRHASLLGLLELRSERPLETFDRLFTWHVTATATKRGP